jgi:hypothetical protein
MGVCTSSVNPIAWTIIRLHFFTAHQRFHCHERSKISDSKRDDSSVATGGASASPTASGNQGTLCPFSTIARLLPQVYVSEASKMPTRQLLPLLAILTLALAGCDEAPVDIVGIVKGATLPSNATKTVGQAFGSAFPNGI